MSFACLETWTQTHTYSPSPFSLPDAYWLDKTVVIGMNLDDGLGHAPANLLGDISLSGPYSWAFFSSFSYLFCFVCVSGTGWILPPTLLRPPSALLSPLIFKNNLICGCVWLSVWWWIGEQLCAYLTDLKNDASLCNDENLSGKASHDAMWPW